MENKKLLPVLLSNNWYFHDQKEYNKIKENSTKLLTVLGYGVNESEHAAELIKELYLLADAADKLGEESFKKMILICHKIDEHLNRPNNSWNEIRWWKAVRDKNYLIGAYYLLVDQLSKVGKTNLIAALRAAKKLFDAGIAHDKKNWQLVRQYTSDYWTIINSVSPRKFIEF